MRIKHLRDDVDRAAVAWISGDIVNVAAALTQLQISLDGTFLAFGLGGLKRALVAEVHASNLSKVDTVSKLPNLQTLLAETFIAFGITGLHAAMVEEVRAANLSSEEIYKPIVLQEPDIAGLLALWAEAGDS